MNPLLEDEQSEGEAHSWRTQSTQTKAAVSSKKKTKLSLMKSNSNLGRKQIDQILENYNYQALHDRIMKQILK